MSEVDEDLEKAIDDVGRDRVFDRAASLGWTGAPPPRWVWWRIVQGFRAERTLKAENDHSLASLTKDTPTP